MREWHGDQVNVICTNSYELRKAYRESGIPWASGERTEAGRKQAQRDLEELARGGLIVLAKPNLSKTLFVKLSDSAYSRLRRQCDLPSFEMGFLMLKLTEKFSVRPPTVEENVFIPETKFNADRGWGDGFQDELFRVSQNALPAVFQGWLVSVRDTQRHIFYAITEKGWKLLDDGWKPGPGEEIKRDLDMSLAYYTSLRIESSKLKTRTPDCDGELGWPFPLSAAHHGLSCARSPAQ